MMQNRKTAAHKLSPRERRHILRRAAKIGIRPAADELHVARSTVFGVVERHRAEFEKLRGPGQARPSSDLRAIGIQCVSDSALGCLNSLEKHQLSRCEAKIRAVRRAFMEMGLALRQIRDARLYREDYLRFEDYTVSRWGLSPSYVNRLIGAAEVAQTLLAAGEIVLHESQVRPLASLEPKKALEVWATAIPTPPDFQFSQLVVAGNLSHNTRLKTNACSFEQFHAVTLARSG